MSKTDNAANRTFTLKRTFDAPVKLVWEAWTRPEHIAHWWGPKGMKINVVEHNFKVGGKWKYTMPVPGGGEFISEGIYSVIEQFKKIFSSAEFRPMTEGVEIQAIFEAKGQKTDFTFNVVHPTEEYHKQQVGMGANKGWGSVFDRLGEFVSSQK
jgi:uncharacterized protein YndB with AHSA1/START domain